ncbi:hypothetical protein [Gluconacetobacter sp.]|uniref:hypothetical protein n=1 Tax=Gluconacetobacter sp. TaxID=1935994 RepID=UPI0039E9668F
MRVHETMRAQTDKAKTVAGFQQHVPIFDGQHDPARQHQPRNTPGPITGLLEKLERLKARALPAPARGQSAP